MSQQSNVRFMTEGLQVWTTGLADQGHPELRVQVADLSLMPESEVFLYYVITYLMQSYAHIRPGQTLAYGYWLTKFQASTDQFLDVWEYTADATEFVPGATLTLTYWRDQHEICERVGAAFTPPRPDRQVIISAGVLEDDSVEGVRYPSPEHMSGWWITTDRYDGNVKSLTSHHLYHVTAARPELARFIALPYGFRFILEDREYIWFDEKIANDAP